MAKSFSHDRHRFRHGGRVRLWWKFIKSLPEPDCKLLSYYGSTSHLERHVKLLGLQAIDNSLCLSWILAV